MLTTAPQNSSPDRRWFCQYTAGANEQLRAEDCRPGSPLISLASQFRGLKTNAARVDSLARLKTNPRKCRQWRSGENNQGKAKVMNELWRAFRQGVLEGWRGYFAPLRGSPWRAAWHARKASGATWWAPFSAWFVEYERIIYGTKNEAANDSRDPR